MKLTSKQIEILMLTLPRRGAPPRWVDATHEHKATVRSLQRKGLIHVEKKYVRVPVYRRERTGGEYVWRHVYVCRVLIKATQLAVDLKEGQPT